MTGLKQVIEDLRGDGHPKNCKDCGYCDSLAALNKKISKFEKLIKVVGGDVWLEEALNLLDSNLGRTFTLDDPGGKT